MTNSPLLTVNQLRVVFNTRNGQQVAVDNLSFSLERGEILGIVGESGSGKSVACYSLLGLIPTPPGKIESGSAIFQGQDLFHLNESELRKIRGAKIAMIFQDPMTSLNPNMRVVDQLVEVLHQHQHISKEDAVKKAITLLDEVGIRDAHKRIFDYPHQFSGGMRQRVMIAIALLADPDLLIADEPTTALDVTVQAQILDLIKKLQQQRNLAVIFITHDLAVASQMADKLIVMQKGKKVEEGSKKDIFHNPQEDYTRKLLASVLDSPKPKSNVCEQQAQPLLTARSLNTWFPTFSGWLFKRASGYIKGVDEVSITLYPGEIVGLVGESGSGKSTLGRSLIRLVEPNSGEVIFDEKNILSLNKNELRKSRAEFQMIFQDPYASLNPRQTIYQTLAEPLLLHDIVSKKEVLNRVLTLMDEVGLDREFIHKYPHEFSGGQRQRIAIARAISVKPKFIVADEPVSALDVTIRAQIIDLLMTLSQKYQMAILFISHDMSVVRYICDRVIVMKKGKIVEEGPTETVLLSPNNAYTQELIKAIPKIKA